MSSCPSPGSVSTRKRICLTCTSFPVVLTLGTVSWLTVCQSTAMVTTPSSAESIEDSRTGFQHDRDVSHRVNPPVQCRGRIPRPGRHRTQLPMPRRRTELLRGTVPGAKVRVYRLVNVDFAAADAYPVVSLANLCAGIPVPPGPGVCLPPVRDGARVEQVADDADTSVGTDPAPADDTGRTVQIGLDGTRLVRLHIEVNGEVDGLTRRPTRRL